jgi:hypothetical protein
MVANSTLRLDRFCGYDVYKIDRAEVFVHMPEEGDDEDGIVLNLEFHCNEVIDITIPEEEGDGSHPPSVQINIPIPSLSLSTLVGKTISIKDAEDGNFMYVYEYEDLRDIAVRFLEFTDSACRISITAKTQDPNHYDGSKPDTTLTLDAWFPLDELKH